MEMQKQEGSSRVCNICLASKDKTWICNHSLYVCGTLHVVRLGQLACLMKTQEALTVQELACVSMLANDRLPWFFFYLSSWSLTECINKVMDMNCCPSSEIRN